MTRRARPWSVGLLVLAVAVVLLATLKPNPGALTTPFGCIICGARGLADAMTNTLLFVPFGAALTLRRVRVRRVWLWAMLLSVGVELVQFAIPGRDASLGDIVFNTLGSTLGAVGCWLAPRALWPTPRRAARLCYAAMVVVGAIFAVTPYLLAPHYPLSTYYGQWTPDLGHLEPYDGRVVEARLGELRVPPTRLQDSRRIQGLLQEGQRLEVLAIAGPKVDGLASLFSIYDEREREIILLGPDRYDLVWRHRTRARALRLDRPDVRLRGALRLVAAGDTLLAQVWRDGSDWCTTLNGKRSCLPLHTAARGWALLLYDGHFPGWLFAALSVSWVCGWMLPIGYWARTRPSRAASVAFLAALAAVPLVSDARILTGLELGLAVTAFCAGLMIERLCRFYRPITCPPYDDDAA